MARMPVSPGETKRQQCEKLRSQLELERSSYIEHWRELGVHIFPRRIRFEITDANIGNRRNGRIIDSTPTMAARTLRSGMMGGITSPARPWFRLLTPNTALNDDQDVKLWLDTVTSLMSSVFLKSNVYNVLPILYGDVGSFGTHASMIEEDFDDTIRLYPFPIGSYMLACDAKGRVDTFVRDFRMTVKQLVQKYGDEDQDGQIDWSIFSPMVKDYYFNNQRESWVDVCQIIRPNDDYDPSSPLSKDKKFSSITYERGAGGTLNGAQRDPTGGTLLREKGYDYFPVLAPRWETAAEDAYGTTCPGMDALGDIKQLMLAEKRIMQAIEKMVNPPMIGPTNLRAQRVSILPGDITYTDEREGTKGFRPAHEVQPRIAELEQKQSMLRERISKVFYEDLFLMMANSDRREITATEIDERKEEKLLALGPVLEQLNQDLLDPLIDITFTLMLRQRQIPPPPESLNGMPLRVEYISIMAQAQKIAGISGIERFAQFSGQVMQAHPEVADKIDADKLIEVYGDMTSVPAQILRSDDVVAQMRQQRQQAQAQQQQIENMNKASGTVKNLASSDTSGDSALSNLIQMSKAGQLAPQ